ncbi:MAG: transporter ATP-binding protein [Hyphomicrobiales bacterium]|nr:transporter ATP-binding protein [Hyphomicrobiales bacterium]
MVDPRAPARKLLVMSFARFAGGFWRGESSRMATWLTIGLAAGLVCKLLVDVGMNRWSRWFFDALERHDAGAASLAAFAFPLLILCIAAVGVWIIRARETLQVRWREWCASRLLERWVGGQRFYRMRMARGGLANPEYRISDDVRMATEPLADFAIGLFTAVLTASTFVVILWTVGGDLDLTWGGAPVHVPAFMVVGALVYGIAVSAFMPVVGGKLSVAAAAKNEAEARFRFEMIRMRENAEAIVLTQGETHALRRLAATNAGLAGAWMRVVAQHARITWLTNGNSAMAPVFPLVLAAPKYLAGDLTLGEVMQLASAFVQVQIAVAWLVDNYSRLAEWFASAGRVVELIDALDSSDADNHDGRPLIERAVSADGSVVLDNLRLSRPSGEIVLARADLCFSPGDRICVSGAAGVGKSALLRAIAGLWLWGEGAIQVPGGRAIAYVAAHPFLPAGRLLDALSFPDGLDAQPGAPCMRALTACGAGHLADRLDDVEAWEHVLSASEKQRVALARLIVTQPRLVLLDDAFSCFGAGEQIALFDLLAHQLPQAILITTGGAAGLADLHSRRLVLERNAAGDIHLTERGADVLPAVVSA